jgi:hypothetical protein
MGAFDRIVQIVFREISLSFRARDFVSRNGSAVHSVCGRWSTNNPIVTPRLNDLRGAKDLAQSLVVNDGMTINQDRAGSRS